MMSKALRAHLGRDRIDLSGHSAGGALAVLYAARYPEHVSRLVLVTPSPMAVGVEITNGARREVAELRRRCTTRTVPRARKPPGSALADLHSPVLLIAGGYDVALPPESRC